MKRAYYSQLPRVVGTYHALGKGARGEVPGLIRRQRERKEMLKRAFIVIPVGMNR